MSIYQIKHLYKYICLEFKNQRQLQSKRQEEVAFDLNVSAGYLSRIENAKKEKVSLYMFLILSDYYNVEFDTIVRIAKEKMKLDEGI